MFGLTVNDVTLYDESRDPGVYNTAGSYDPKHKLIEVYTDIPDVFNFSAQAAYAQEYAHALQDTAFDLSSLHDSVGAGPWRDHVKALVALIEGDAMWTGANWVDATQSLGPTLTEKNWGKRNSTSIEKELNRLARLLILEEFLLSLSLFEYEEGKRFVVALAQHGDPAAQDYGAVDAAYSNPPVRTEQILHPEKYLAGEVGTPESIPDFSGSLGNLWNPTDQFTRGEFG